MPIFCHLDILTPLTIEELSKIAPVVGSKVIMHHRPNTSIFAQRELGSTLPILYQIVDLSLESGCVPHSLKQAILKALL